ncbi:MAG: hypothetical protein KUG75_07295 [Pseudomonadales bacterium]|nr:hypothetical protein [Pseudomonadales bacterium]
MSFSESIIGREFGWGGINFFIVEVQGDSVVAVYRDNDNLLVRVRAPLAQALQTIDTGETVIGEVPGLNQAAS